MDKFLEMLGIRVRDKVTGFRGVVTSVSFDLYGCVQMVVTPEAKTEDPGDLKDGRWFDEKRLEVFSDERVMDRPTFDVIPGPASKSLPPSGPLGR